MQPQYFLFKISGFSYFFKISIISGFSRLPVSYIPCQKSVRVDIMYRSEDLDWKIGDMDYDTLSQVPYESLVCYTDNFSVGNFLGHFQFGKFYHGKIVRNGGVQHVVVKIWEVPVIYSYRPGENELRLLDELTLLRRHTLISHPGLVTLCEYCFDGEHLGVVYEFKALDSLYYLIPKDGFTWLQRIKVALRFAILLKFLHAGNPRYKPYIVRNLDAAHILLEEDYNPKLCDFGTITGGIFPDRTKITEVVVRGCYGYIDERAAILGIWSDEQDVFAFGTILLSLISKRVYTEEDRVCKMPNVNEWAWDKYHDNSDKYSLVHESLTAESDFDPVDGRKITCLGIQCLHDSDYYRPTMKQVVKRLLKLKVVKRHADFLGVNTMHSP
ncbi:probable serine/threonine-protein kinase PBL17 isoform X1 [Primulina huaijiensis]|uniref:probable serine/threonine-protein kinase PBL17 isoform X1 n=3 Tax=Primulina huaijiensis TaxID=1492673 RepID=UPI003CC6F717